VAIRFDRGSAVSVKQPYTTEDGTLLAEATFARDGVLEYQRADGSVRRELRPAEENQKALPQFGLAPVTIEHPDVGLLTEDNATDYRKGISLQDVVYGKGGFVRGAIAVYDSLAKDLITSREKVEVSAGYRCDLDETPGIWIDSDGARYRYDAVQRNIRVNHIALTSRGRAGPDVCVRIDSLDDPDVAYQTSQPEVLTTTTDRPKGKPRMANLRIDGAEYSEVPEVVAAVLAPKLKRLDSLEETVPGLQESLDNTKEELTRTEGRADALEYCLGNAEEILTEMGYRRDSDGNYFREDKKNTKEVMPEDPDAEEEPDEEDAGGGPPWKKKFAKKKDMKKKDMASSEKKDSADEPRYDTKTILAAWKEADRLVPAEDGESFSDRHFDSIAEDIPALQKAVIAELRPKLKLDSKSDEQIAAIYELIKDDVESRAAEEEEGEDDDRQDSRQDSSYTGDFSKALAASRQQSQKSRKSPIDDASEQSRQRTSEAYKQPLALSK